MPYSKAPPLRKSNFDQMRKLDVLDGKTHDFTSAWNAGYTGEGSTVGVMDGGTDFGHPDLIGTWQTWSGARDTTRREVERLAEGLRPVRHAAGLALPGRSLERPVLVHADNRRELPTPVHAHTCPVRSPPAPARRATSRRPTGPPRTPTSSRARGRSPATSSSAGTRTTTCSPPTASARRSSWWTPRRRASTTRSTSTSTTTTTSPTRSRSARTSPAVLPRHRRRRLHRPLGRPPLLHLRRQDPASRAGPVEFGDDDAPAAGALLAWTWRLRPGDRGPRHAHGLQRRRPGRDQRQGADLHRPAGRHVPGRGARRRAARQARSRTATSTSIFEISTQIGYLFSTEHGIDVTSNSYGDVRDRQRRLRRRLPGGGHHLRRLEHDVGVLDRQRRARRTARRRLRHRPPA